MTKGMATQAEEMKNTWQVGVQDLAYGLWGNRSGRSLWPPLLMPLKQVIRSSWGGVPFPYLQERSILTPKSQRRLQHAGEVSSRSLRASVPTTLLPERPLFIKPGSKTLKSNCFFRSSFPYEGPQVMLNLTLISILSSCWCCRFNFQTQPRTLRG